MMSNALSGQEICDIISACASAKVSTFMLADLSISFVPLVKPDESWSHLTAPANDAEANGDIPASNFHKQVTADVLNDLDLTDPVAFERYISDKEHLDDYKD